MANMDLRSVLLLLSFTTLMNGTQATDVPAECSNERQYFELSRTNIWHHCTDVCNYRDPHQSPPDCRELCPGLFDCLVRTTKTKNRIRNPFTISQQTPKASPVQIRLYTVEDEPWQTAKASSVKQWMLYILSGISVFLGALTLSLVAIVVWRICRRSRHRNAWYSDDNTLTVCTEDGTHTAYLLIDDADSSAVVKASDANNNGEVLKSRTG